MEASLTNRLAALVLSLLLLAAACGDDGDTAAETTTTEATTTTAETTTTTAETTTTGGGSIVPGEDPDVDAVVEAYQVVFDSSTTFGEKAPYLVDPTGLEETVATYGQTGDSMGGVTLEPTMVTIDGDQAAVVYDFLFGGNPAYQGLEGDAVRTDAGWKVTREMFCSIMTSAQVGCPPS